MYINKRDHVYSVVCIRRYIKNVFVFDDILQHSLYYYYVFRISMSTLNLQLIKTIIIYVQHIDNKYFIISL